jgi:hypothetical protein
MANGVNTAPTLKPSKPTNSLLAGSYDTDCNFTRSSHLVKFDADGLSIQLCLSEDCFSIPSKIILEGLMGTSKNAAWHGEQWGLAAGEFVSSCHKTRFFWSCSLFSPAAFPMLQICNISPHS